LPPPLRSAALLCAGAVACAAATAALAAAAGKSYTLPFAEQLSCLEQTHRPALAPSLPRAGAELTMPAGWHTIRVPASTGSGLPCATPFLLGDAPGDANQCLPVSAHASVAEDAAGLPLAAFLRSSSSEVGHGQLPALADLRGIWEELEIGALPGSAYAVVAAYESPARRLVYELTLIPTQPPDAGCLHGSGARSRTFARAIARSFRVTLAG
jgi:hypothetical protein